MSELQQLFSSWTPGSYGIWSIFALLLLTWWKGLPAVLEAWTNRLDKERGHREREIERLERQIQSADDRHDECMEGQKRLRDEIGRLEAIISGMVIQLRQMQLSSANLSGGFEASAFSDMIAKLDRLPAMEKKL